MNPSCNFVIENVPEWQVCTNRFLPLSCANSKQSLFLRNSKDHPSRKSCFNFEEMKQARATLPTAEILSDKNARAFLVCGFLMKSIKKNILKI